MDIVSRSALVEFSANQMYDLVNAVNEYQNFLPWCSKSEILEQSDSQMKAKVDISKAKIKQSFTTLNELILGKKIELKLVEGPFRKLDGLWLFKELSPTACKVSLDLKYEFSNVLLEKVVGPVFNQITNTMLDAFVKQAGVIYSNSGQ